MFRSMLNPSNIPAAGGDDVGVSHFYANLYVHLVWSTTNRAPLISDRQAPRLHRRLAMLVAREHSEALAVGGVADHVHLLVALHPAVAVSTLVRVLKANTSQWFRAEAHVDAFSWQEGYGVFSLCREDIEAVRQYVLRQPERHATKDTFDAWEYSQSPPCGIPATRNPPGGG